MPGLDADPAVDIQRLSAGQVRQIAPSGPVFSSRPGPRRNLRKCTFARALSGWDRLIVASLSGGWLICLAAFWTWWLQPVHRIGSFGLAINSIILSYVLIFPIFFVVSANRLRRVSRAVPVAPFPVAFVVTRAPSEQWEVTSRTLTAMLAQDYPYGYDVWLCDEQPTEEAIGWCRLRGVRLSTRSGLSSYHRGSWPRRTGCKEGNLAYFYDNWGYRTYQVVAQLDCDHVPSATYLAEMMRPFSDPAVGYVAAPSVCDGNAAQSWATRGRVYREATFHGPFQLGHNYGFSPLCIGSHYAVRTAALRDIGGIGPELAEDFSTTFLLNAAGWQGAFAIDAEAHGTGPATFTAMGVQEFQWARSLTTILLGLVPRNLRRLDWYLRGRFLYALLYYVLLTGTALVGLVLAPVAAISGQAWVNISYLGFLVHLWSVSVWLVLLTVLLRSRGLLRPPTAPILSWEAWLYSLTRWPYVALGIAAAVARRIRPRRMTFKVTPKAAAGIEPLHVRQVVPFVVISIVSAGAAIYGEMFSDAAGYVFLCLLEAAAYAMVAIAVPVLHASQIAATAGIGRGVAIRQTVAAPLIWAVTATAVTAVAISLYPGYALRLFGR